MPETTSVEATIAGQAFVLSDHEIVDTLRALAPEPIASHFVVIDGRRFPPKQVICAVTGLDRADFTTHQARRTLKRLGFTAGRRGGGGGIGNPRADPETPLIEQLRPLVGQWVATKDDDVLHAAATPQAVVSWLSRHGQQADSMFRVPEDDHAASGLAPL
jgi:hypothetical protein